MHEHNNSNQNTTDKTIQAAKEIIAQQVLKSLKSDYKSHHSAKEARKIVLNIFSNNEGNPFDDDRLALLTKKFVEKVLTSGTDQFEKENVLKFFTDKDMSQTLTNNIVARFSGEDRITKRALGGKDSGIVNDATVNQEVNRIGIIDLFNSFKSTINPELNGGARKSTAAQDEARMSNYRRSQSDISGHSSDDSSDGDRKQSASAIDALNRPATPPTAEVASPPADDLAKRTNLQRIIAVSLPASEQNLLISSMDDNKKSLELLNGAGFDELEKRRQANLVAESFQDKLKIERASESNSRKL